MAKVHIVDVKVLNNPCPFFSPFQFEIVFECIDEIPEDLEWKLTYVGSAESAAHDQILNTVVVGPLPVGKHKFVFQADQPDPEKIPVADAIGVTAVLLTCSYKEHEFVRVGYFVNNDYIDDLELNDNPPPVPQYDKMTRNILEEPRVTRFKIDWGGEVCEATNEMEMETQVEMRENAESSQMELPLEVETTQLRDESKRRQAIDLNRQLIQAYCTLIRELEQRLQAIFERRNILEEEIVVLKLDKKTEKNVKNDEEEDHCALYCTALYPDWYSIHDDWGLNVLKNLVVQAGLEEELNA